MTNQLDPRILESRMVRLERYNRYLTGALLLSLVGGSMAAFSFRQNAPIARAGGFELVDEEGSVRARLQVNAEGAGLHLLDESGRTRVSVVHDPDQSALFLRDADGQIRVGAAQFAHGGGGFALHGPQSKGGAILYLKGSGSLSFLDAEGNLTHRVPEP